MKQGRLDLFKGHQVMASTFQFKGKVLAPHQATLDPYEETVLLIKVKNEEISYPWIEPVGMVQHHKLSAPTEVIVIPPAQQDSVWDQCREMQDQNVEASIGVSRMVNGDGDD